MKKNKFKKWQGRGHSGLAGVVTLLALLLFVGTVAMAQQTVSVKENTADADKWQGKAGDATEFQTLPIEAGSKAKVQVKYTGDLEVKSIKAKKKGAPAATVTTAPTATTGDIVAGSETALVSGGTATGGTMMYKVTTENTQPTSTEGFSATVPTAQSLAAGTFYVWYYVKADDTHSDSEIAGPVTVTVKAAAPAEGHALSTSAVGEIVGTDGKAYAVADKNNLPTGVTAAGMVAYKNGSNGLAIALSEDGEMVWSTATGANGAAAHTPKVTGKTWKLPSVDEWKQMFTANGGSEESYTGLNTAITNAGGTALQVGIYYWTSVEYDSDWKYAWYVNPDGGKVWYNSDEESYNLQVRACLAF